MTLNLDSWKIGLSDVVLWQQRQVIMAPTGGWYVNGAGAYCPEHIPAVARTIDSETWPEYDRHQVVRDLIEEGQPKIIEPDPKAKRIADALADR